MNKKNIKKSRDGFIKCAIRAKKNNDKEKEKQFIDLAVILNNLLLQATIKAMNHR